MIDEQKKDTDVMKSNRPVCEKQSCKNTLEVKLCVFFLQGFEEGPGEDSRTR